MSDSKRMTADEQLRAFAGSRVTVCRCVGCRANFLSLHGHSKWCSAGCRKAAYKERKATGDVAPRRVTLHDLGLAAIPVGVTIEEAAQHVVFSAPGRCVHCNGKVRLRSNDAICGMCGLNFDGA